MSLESDKKINFIVNNLMKGVLTNKENYLLFQKEYSLSKQSFNTYWKKAKVKYKRRIEKIENNIVIESAKVEVKAYKNQVLSKVEALEILSDIAKGKDFGKGNNVKTPSFDTRIKAIESLKGMIAGFEVPKKSENTNVNIKLQEWVNDLDVKKPIDITENKLVERTNLNTKNEATEATEANGKETTEANNEANNETTEAETNEVNNGKETNEAETTKGNETTELKESIKTFKLSELNQIYANNNKESEQQKETKQYFEENNPFNSDDID